MRRCRADKRGHRTPGGRASCPARHEPSEAVPGAGSAIASAPPAENPSPDASEKPPTSLPTPRLVPQLGPWEERQDDEEETFNSDGSSTHSRLWTSRDPASGLVLGQRVTVSVLPDVNDYPDVDVFVRRTWTLRSGDEVLTELEEDGDKPVWTVAGERDSEEVISEDTFDEARQHALGLLASASCDALPAGRLEEIILVDHLEANRLARLGVSTDNAPAIAEISERELWCEDPDGPVIRFLLSIHRNP